MKMNLKLEVLKVFLLDFSWETGKNKLATTEIVYEKDPAVEKPALPDQTSPETK